MVFLSRGKPLFLNLVPDFGNSKVQTERGEGGREGREGREGGSEKEKEREREYEYEYEQEYEYEYERERNLLGYTRTSILLM